MKASETIRSAIEERVMSGELKPGDLIDDAALAARHGVSRTPVREAILQLQARGLLATVPRGGVVVAKLDVQQLFAMWEVLIELESYCAQLACERMTPHERKSLADTHRAAGSIVATGDRAGWQQANLAFHECLYRGSRNTYLREEILRARTRTGAYRNHAFSAFGLLQASHAQHGIISDAIVANDAEAVRRAMRDHMVPGQGMKGLTDLIVNLPRELLD
jgi:DNA-binding GntR family transcriptional regulator